MANLKNIETAYTQSVKKYRDFGVHKSIHWEKNFNDGRVFDFNELNSFRKNMLSDGLDDRYSPKEQLEIFIKLISDLPFDFVLNNLTEENVGNSADTFKFRDKIVDAGRCFHIYWLAKLNEAVFAKGGVEVVCEIGGGYGSLADLIIKNHRVTYILIDLPETNILSTFFLQTLHPNKKILTYSEIEQDLIEKNLVEEYDIIIIPPWVVLDSAIKVDLFINTRSMMEMNNEVINQYFHTIQSHISDHGFFFNVNRYYKDTVGYPVMLHEYPYDSNWKVLKSESSWMQNWIHLLLTQRCSIHESDIDGELGNIAEVGKVFQSPKSYQTIWKNNMKSKIFKLVNCVMFGIPRHVIISVVRLSRKIGMEIE